MENTKSSQPFSEVSEGEIIMMAAEEHIGSLFEEADNDSKYHKSVIEAKEEVIHGKCSCDAEEVAESILAWSGAL